MPRSTPPTSAFHRELAARNSDPAGRRWLYVPYDQLSDAIGPLSREDPEELGIVLLESPEKAGRRPYHKQKLALVLANLRHFALEQAERGVAVDHRIARGTFGEALREIAREKAGAAASGSAGSARSSDAARSRGSRSSSGTPDPNTPAPLRAMRPAERELREDLRPLLDEGLLTELPHEGWLSTPEQFRASQKPTPPWRMDAFYRHVRRETGWLMDERGKPLGGKFSFDAENREPWKGEPPAATPPTFQPDAVTEEVLDLVATRFADHPGELDPATLPASRQQATALWTWAKRECLPHFGPHEDAMSTRSRTLFHSRVSALVHLHRLTPRRLVEDVCTMDLALNSQEGFLRQVLGWREFVRHVHESTDGFRRMPSGFAAPPYLDATTPLPAAWWGTPSGLNCLDTVVRSVLEEGYSHHITRLMVLSNLATLLDVAPRELSDWFWAMYTDAYDWVVEPNVLAMGTFGVGDLMTTKPYVSGAAYIARMSDYCEGCALDPKKDCPITPMYWAFLARHRERLEGNPRLRMPYASLRKRAETKWERDARVFDVVRERLEAAKPVEPGSSQ